jgi:ubiquinone/menaquinone biosynthesis C-methylase UbiE
MTSELNSGKGRVCPVSLAGSLDNRFRRWLQNPVTILTPYVKDGMTVLDIGCGPGFFTLALAEIVGESGHVIAADLQKGMLEKLGNKINGTELENRITLHKCEGDRIKLKENVDFVLAFYMVHEIPDKAGFFTEIFDLLKPAGQFLLVEPKLFHVSKKEFEDTVNNALSAGFEAMEKPKLLFSMAVVFKKAGAAEAKI